MMHDNGTFETDSAARSEGLGIHAEEHSHDEHKHYSHRAPWLRAAVLGAMDGLVSVAALILGVDGGNADRNTVLLAGVAALVAGAMSMMVGEFVSVCSQRDIEMADVQKEIDEQRKGSVARRHELEELALIYVERGLDLGLATKVAEAFTEKDVIRAHARDELGVDIDDYANPYTAALASGAAFTIGAAIPVLSSGFIESNLWRPISCAAATSIMLCVCGATTALLGGSSVVKSVLRLVLGGWMALGITYGIGSALGVSA